MSMRWRARNGASSGIAASAPVAMGPGANLPTGKPRRAAIAAVRGIGRPLRLRRLQQRRADGTGRAARTREGGLMSGWDLRENWLLYLIVALPWVVGAGIVGAVVFVLGWLSRGVLL